MFHLIVIHDILCNLFVDMTILKKYIEMSKHCIYRNAINFCEQYWLLSKIVYSIFLIMKQTTWIEYWFKQYDSECQRFQNNIKLHLHYEKINARIRADHMLRPK